VEYLGNIVSHEGVKVEHNKIKSMVEWSIPKTLKNIRWFLGLTTYYHNVVKKYGLITTPLTILLKNNVFYWTQEATQDFEKLKEAMCRTPGYN
jgi:hypothetical protein